MIGKIIGWVVVLALVVWGIFALINDGTPEDDGPIKIGFMGPLSGDAASYGESTKKGVDLALKDFGLENVEIIYEDSRCEPGEAVNVINKLIEIDKVSAVVGELCSSATLAAAPIAVENRTVLISAASTAPDLSKAGNYVFRTVPSDALQGSFGAQLVYDLGYKKLAILFGNEDYGIGFEKVLREEFEKLGGKTVSESFSRDSNDLRTQITKIKSESPDAVYLISNSPKSAVAAIKQLKELGLKSVIFGAEGLKSDEILNGAGDSAEGMIVTSVSSGSSGFIERHRVEYGEGPGPFAAQAYDAFTALAMAVKDGARTGEAIKNFLLNVEFDGASGMIKFDQNGDVSGNYDIFVVQDGTFVLNILEGVELKSVTTDDSMMIEKEEDGEVMEKDGQ
jgi:branched-chain amino acid transport system substrate-binding protein